MPDPNNVLIPEHRLAFMAIPRCGNTALKSALAAALGRRGYVHDPAIFETGDKRTCARLRAEGWLVFAVVRDPMQRLVSCWRGKVAGPVLHSGFRRYAWARAGMAFDDFAWQVCHTPDARAEQHFRSQAAELLLDGRQVPELLLRFERLEQGWARLQVRVEAHCGLVLPVLARMNQSPSPPPVMDRETAAMIRQRYIADYEAFFPTRAAEAAA